MSWTIISHSCNPLVNALIADSNGFDDRNILLLNFIHLYFILSNKKNPIFGSFAIFKPLFIWQLPLIYTCISVIKVPYFLLLNYAVCSKSSPVFGLWHLRDSEQNFLLHKLSTRLCYLPQLMTHRSFMYGSIIQFNIYFCKVL